jgi:lycopene beta-cyclase
MSSTIYDFAIVGAGAAGLQLALAMKDDAYFRNRRILILDKSVKKLNDKTWCFWETGAGRYDSIITHSWSMADFMSKQKEVRLDLYPYRYKMLRSLDFYDYARKEIELAPNMTWVQDDVVLIRENSYVEIQGTLGGYAARHIFDSRIPAAFGDKSDSYIRLLQHFRGWYIQTDADIFDSSKFLMMDFRLQWKDTTSFTYVLPTSERTALVEFTLFTPTLISNDDYDQMLRQYLDQILKIGAYVIKEVEAGVIPMSNYPFYKHNTNCITKIGTAGGWVKPSSGYSFKNSDRFSKKIVKNIKSGVRPSAGIAIGRFRKYDSLFLDVLMNRNELGASLFTAMYTQNSPESILKFLDEETTWLEDLSIMRAFDQPLFIRTLFKQLRRSVLGR